MALDDEVAALRASPIFGDIDLPSLKRIALAGERYELAAGETLFAAGDPPDAVYFILSGTLSVRGDAGEIATLGPSDVAGDMSVICGRARESTVVAKTDASVTSLPGDPFLALVSERPKSALATMRMLSDRISAANRLIATEADNS